MRTALLLAALWSAASLPQDRGRDPESWTAPIAPVKIIDNIYYVGTVDLASYLITSPAGHILIGTGVPENADRVAVFAGSTTANPWVKLVGNAPRPIPSSIRMDIAARSSGRARPSKPS